MLFFILSFVFLILLSIYVVTHIDNKQHPSFNADEEQEVMYHLIERAGHYHPYDNNYLK